MNLRRLSGRDMGESKQLGISWGKNSLYVVDMAAGKPGTIFSVPLPRDAGGSSIEAGPFSPAGMEIISLIQNTFRQHKLSAGTAYVSLPTRDIIFRSFVIPWMQPNEVKGVVDFEASKYVPFALHDLSYSFYPMTVTEGNLRRIRIIFVAIKKAVLESYRQILEQAALRVHIAEPATLSLIRAMAAKELLPREETVALVEIGDEMGNIIVVDHHMPQFVREFQLRIPGATQENPDPRASMTRMINEVRISLNYFNRQEERFKVGKTVILSSTDPAEMIRRLEDDLHMPAAVITTDSILADVPSGDVNFLKAYGAALYHSVNLPVDLNLLEAKAKTVRLASAPVKTQIHYRPIMIAALICLPGMFLSPFLAKTFIARQENRAAALSRELSSFKETPAPQMRQENEALSEKLNYFKDVQPESDIAAVLVTIPALLPEGVWVDQIDIVCPEIFPPDGKGRKEGGGAAAVKGEAAAAARKPALDIKGYAYAGDPGDQFQLAYDLLANFKADKEFSAFFDSIDFASIQAKFYGKYPATFFHLICR